MEWDEIYSFQKMLPLLTRWQLMRSDATEIKCHRGYITPSFIRKKRAPRGIPSYEIVWSDTNKDFHDLITDEQLDRFRLQNSTLGLETLWTTIEPIELVNRIYPELVEEYELARVKVKKPTKVRGARKKKIDPSTPTMVVAKKKVKHNDSLNNFDQMKDALDEAVIGKKSKRKGPQPVAMQRIDTFFEKAQATEKLQISDLSLVGFFVDNLNEDSDTENIQDLSNIVANIVQRSPVLKKCEGRDLIVRKIDTQEALVNVSAINHSMDDIDLMILNKKPRTNSGIKNVSSLTEKNEMQSSTPHAKLCPSKRDLLYEEEPERSFFFEDIKASVDHFQKSMDIVFVSDSSSDSEGNETD